MARSGRVLEPWLCVWYFEHLVVADVLHLLQVSANASEVDSDLLPKLELERRLSRG